MQVDIYIMSSLDNVCLGFFYYQGFPDDMIDKLRNMETTIELKKDGDMWSYEIKSSIMPDKVVKFKSGEEVVTDFMGKDVKVKYMYVVKTMIYL